MNYLPKINELVEIANFFCRKYNFTVTTCSEQICGMGCAVIKLNKENFPPILIEMERYIISFQVEFEENAFVSMECIYKYFNPKEILRSNLSYRKKKNFKNFFISDYDKYMDFYIKNFSQINFEKINEFYTKYPVYVWKWIEK